MEKVFMLWLIGVIILFIGFWLGKRVTEIQHENYLYRVPDINDGNIDFSKIPDEDRNKINRDIELISSVITEICDYAVKNGLEPNETLKRISSNILFVGEISDFNDWGKITETKK